MILKPGAKIRVVTGAPPSGAPDGFVSSPPVTMVNVTRADQEGQGGDIYLALVDTGFDYIAIDGSVAARLGASLKGNGVSGGAIGRGAFGMQAGLKFADIKIFFPGANVIFNVPMAAVIDVRKCGSFDLILGRDFLKHCRLTVDGPNAAYDLEWVDIPPSIQSS